MNSLNVGFFDDYPILKEDMTESCILWGLPVIKECESNSQGIYAKASSERTKLGEGSGGGGHEVAQQGPCKATLGSPSPVLGQHKTQQDGDC